MTIWKKLYFWEKLTACTNLLSKSRNCFSSLIPHEAEIFGHFCCSHSPLEAGNSKPLCFILLRLFSCQYPFSFIAEIKSQKGHGHERTQQQQEEDGWKIQF